MNWLSWLRPKKSFTTADKALEHAARLSPRDRSLPAALRMRRRGQASEAERAYEWLADIQRPDGSWHNYYLPDGGRDDTVEDAKLTHLAYAPEIAQVMLRRQQAEAIIAARSKIVQGAVGMVDMALKGLSERNLVNLDDERRAAMVSNLLVVLCAENEATPVINTGTLYT